MSDTLAQVAGELAISGALWRDFMDICSLGGRFAGTESEARAREFLAARLTEETGLAVARYPVPYDGWRRGPCTLERLSPTSIEIPAHSLVRSVPTPPGGIEAELLDLGRGTPEDFRLSADLIPGRIVLVRHEYMIASGTIHRRRKYNLAKQMGAKAFLVGCHVPGGLLVTGSSGFLDADDIPAAGISYEGAGALFARPEGFPRVRLEIAAERVPATTYNLFCDIPGRTEESVFLTAHIDGHDLALSAIDNASGLAIVLAVARTLAPHVAKCRRGLRIGLFTVEEWALTGSRVWADALSEAECDRIALNVNLDSLAGHPKLTALTSGFGELDAFVRQAAGRVGERIGTHRPILSNSDHFNFLRRGIPALRLCCGMDAPESNMKYLLTPGDTPDKVAPAELKNAAQVTAAIVWAALNHDGPIARRRSPAEVQAMIGG